MANRYFLADLPPPGRHPLPDALAHHLGRVLRARVGDELQLGDGRGGTALATIAELDRRGVQVEVAGDRKSVV